MKNKREVRKRKQPETWDGLILEPDFGRLERGEMSREELAALYRRKDVETRGMKGEIPLVPRKKAKP
jgi:hypothetical protein